MFCLSRSEFAPYLPVSRPARNIRDGNAFEDEYEHLSITGILYIIRVPNSIRQRNPFDLFTLILLSLKKNFKISGNQYKLIRQTRLT